MTAELALVKPAEQPDLTAIERVIVAGDLSELTPDERWNYYRGVCQSVGLNPFTQPFLYITLSGKLVLYATKGAADQLRDNHRISISQPKIDLSDGLCIVTVTATDKTGRTDSDLGIVPVENLRGDAKANAILKAVTKAKRRVTLSMCGLGMLDETEVETIPNARPANVETIPQHALTEPTERDLGSLDVDPVDAPAPAEDGWTPELREKWAAGLAARRALGLTERSDLKTDATRAEIIKALREVGHQVTARKTACEAFATLTKQALDIGIDVEVIDPKTLTPETLHETSLALNEMYQAALREAGGGPSGSPDDDEAF